ncbi:NADH ubiquinone oxidoreductase subunit NDUFA12-domain-containing protein [Chytriomyces sp. MP71]|nr:NADH ubiquinone oxidoreductase subunit NDUFA12-domain-containing protein [Chytriomyces sp. MP71]
MSSWNNVALATLQAVRAHGLFKTFKQIVTLDTPKVGTLVGKDQFGNEYYENRKDVMGRDRWVIYDKWNYDASQVPPEWHQWLSRFTDDIPTEQTVPKAFYVTTHTENYTGSTGAFKTYSTVKPKIAEWEPVSRR